VPGRQLGGGVAAPLGVQVCLVQVRAHQREQCPVTLGEVWAGPAGQGQPHIPAGSSGSRWRFGQVQHEIVLEPQWPVVIGVHTCAAPLSGRVEVRDLYDAALSVVATGATTKHPRRRYSGCAGLAIRRTSDGRFHERPETLDSIGQTIMGIAARRCYSDG
jgi:hypothetical protein